MIGKIAVHIGEEDRDYLKYVKDIASTLGLAPDFFYIEEDYLLNELLTPLRETSEEKQTSIRKYVEELFENFNLYILDGKREENLLQLQDNYDLVFVKYKRKLFGKSISEWLLHATDNLRLWIYKEGSSSNIKKVGIPIDFSERSIRQVDFADYLKDYFSFDYDLIYAINTKRLINKFSKRDYEKILSDKREEVTHMYTDTFGRRDINFILLEGDPYREMVKHINSSEYDLVIVGKRGKGMREKLGSVSIHLARNLKCPLIVL